MKRYVCIHGHFYQPPRENPWLEEIELQDSAYPYRDWNERITAECYRPNAFSRILNDKGEIVDIVNNYALMSFNFGPTLLNWLEKFRPDVYAHILEADKLSQKKFSGCGSAIAQGYNHMILPLANERDRHTQVIWGIKDFEYRFKRKPDGMWLPETAVNLETLEVLVQQGIQFTILSPYQARKIRKIGDEKWMDIKEVPLDPLRPYICLLPSGKQIVIFFYDGPVSHDIAFGGLLNNGEIFGKRLIDAFPPEQKENRLVHVATDGETFGHHHRFGNMALSYSLGYIEENHLAQITIYAEYLIKNSPQYEVQIHENSSWSCSHGIERWRSDCGCRIGGPANWNQSWRVALRDSLDWLRDELCVSFEQELEGLLKNPWDARNEYIQVVLDRSKDNIEKFLNAFRLKDLSKEEKVKVLKLLEMQRHAMLMYTSCGWFFDEISGIETVQIIEYAARAIQLLKAVNGRDLEGEFLSRIEKAKSNIPEMKNGAVVYQKHVVPSIIDLRHVAAHYAMSSLFEDYPEKTKVYCFQIESKNYEMIESGKQKLVFGKASVFSEITWDECVVEFAVLHFGDYNLSGGVRYYSTEDNFNTMQSKLKAAFNENNLPSVIHLMSEFFGLNIYSLWDLFKNEQGRVLNQIFNNTLETIDSNFRAIYDHYYPLMQVKPDFHIPLPKALSMTVEFILNRDFVEVLENDDLDIERLKKISLELRRWSFSRDRGALAYKAGKRINKLMAAFIDNKTDDELLKTLCAALEVFRLLDLDPDLAYTQESYFEFSRSPELKKIFNGLSVDKRTAWKKHFIELGKYLKIRIEFE